MIGGCQPGSTNPHCVSQMQLIKSVGSALVRETDAPSLPECGRGMRRKMMLHILFFLADPLYSSSTCLVSWMSLHGSFMNHMNRPLCPQDLCWVWLMRDTGRNLKSREETGFIAEDPFLAGCRLAEAGSSM